MSIEEMVDAPSAPSSNSRTPADSTADPSPVRPKRRLDLLRKPFVVMPIATILVIALLWWFFGRSDGGAANTTLPQQVVTVSRGTMSETVSADGTVAAAQTDELNFTVAGTVTEVDVKAGDTVSAGQVLARINSAELQATVASANSNLADAEAKLADDQDSGASDEQIAADETSVTSAKDSLASAEKNLAGAALVATLRRNGGVGRPHRRRGARKQRNRRIQPHRLRQRKRAVVLRPRFEQHAGTVARGSGVEQLEQLEHGLVVLDTPDPGGEHGSLHRRRLGRHERHRRGQGRTGSEGHRELELVDQQLPVRRGVPRRWQLPRVRGQRRWRRWKPEPTVEQQCHERCARRRPER